MTYRPAVMMDDASLEALLRKHCLAYRAEPSQSTIEALAEALHRFAPASLIALEQLGGPTVDELRAAYAIRSA